MTTTKIVVNLVMAMRHSLRILPAEHNIVNEKLAIRLLMQMGYDTDVVVNGVEAISRPFTSRKQKSDLTP